MIFFFGTRSSHLKSKVLDHETCPGCGRTDSMLCSVYGRYAHLFWIPLFPTIKTVHTQCQSCGAQWSLHSMTPELKEAALRFRNEQRRPFLHFTGLILLALLVGFLMFGFYVSGKNRQLYLSDPQVYDCYMLLNSEDGFYTFARIEEIEGDTIWFSFNHYSFKSYSEISKYTADEYFGNEWYPYLKDEIDFEGEEDNYSLRRIIRHKEDE